MGQGVLGFCGGTRVARAGGGRGGGSSCARPFDRARLTHHPAVLLARPAADRPRLQSFQGLVLSAFFFGYAATQVLGGESLPPCAGVLGGGSLSLNANHHPHPLATPP